MRSLIGIALLLVGNLLMSSNVMAQLDDATKIELARELGLCTARLAIMDDLINKQGAQRGTHSAELRELFISWGNEYYVHGSALIGQSEFTAASNQVENTKT